MAALTPAVPSRDELLRLAEAALCNAGDLLDDARRLAETGSFPRAYALATLACEELGKLQLCFRAMWLPYPPKLFWSSFHNHTGKLGTAQSDFVAESGDPIASSHVFNERVWRGSRSAHARKLRGLYVDYIDGTLQLPCEITEPETRQLIDSAQKVLDSTEAGWDERMGQVEFLSRWPESYQVIWLTFLFWAADNAFDRVKAVLRDGWSVSVLSGMLERFQQDVGAAGGIGVVSHAYIAPRTCERCVRNSEHFGVGA